MRMRGKAGATIIAATLVCVMVVAAPRDARDVVATLDTEFQAAVKANDAQVIDRILHKDMVLVHGNGTVSTRAELLQDAHDKGIVYEQQAEDPGTQTVRVWGDTAIVTARLWVKGIRRDGTVFDRRLWFSDIYIRTNAEWRYVFGQVSLPASNASSSAQ